MNERPTDAIPAEEMQPREFKVAPWGEFTGLDGVTRIVNETTLGTLPDYQRVIGLEEVALDFEHNTVPKLDENNQPIANQPDEEPKIIAGYGTLEVRANDGIYFIPTWWTPQGAAAYRSGSYRDLSPTLLDLPSTHVVIGIHSVALTRAGQIPNLTAYSAAQFTPKTQTQDNMEEYKKLVAALIGAIKQVNPDSTLTEESSIDDVVGALTPFLTPQNAEQEEPAKKPETAPQNADAAKAAESKEEIIEKLVEQVSAMSADLETMKKMNSEAETTEKDKIIEEAVAEGKQLPMSATKLKSLSKPMLAELLNGLTPNVVPMSARSVASNSGQQQRSASEQEMRSRWGLK